MVAPISTLIQTIGGFATFLNKAGKAGKSLQTTSLVDATRQTRVEPLTVISRDCLNLEYMPEVLQSVLSLFTSYYLQAVSLYAQVNGVEIRKVLTSLNPDLKQNAIPVFESYKDTVGISMEAHGYRLPTSKNARALSDEQFRIAKEGEDSDNPLNNNIKVLNDVSNLSVGKIITVKVTINDQVMSIPVAVRLASVTIPNSSILHILTFRTEDTGIIERFHQWRAGRLTFIKDFILCQDMINVHKKALMEDDNGTYSEMIARANSAKSHGLMSGVPSLVSASNIVVISEEVAKEVEHKLGGKLSNARIRNKAFENTYAMLIVVVDREWERVTIYHRGISMPTNVSIRDIKMSNKSSSKGPDIMDTLKALQQGTAPVF